MAVQYSSRASSSTSTSPGYKRSWPSLRDLVRQLQGIAWDHRRAAALRDEAPAAYKDITRVMRAQHHLVRITRRLRPLLSYKAA